MLEWMKDPNVCCFFRFNTDKLSQIDVEKFITHSQDDKSTYHFAIVDDSDSYLGTVSLKNVDITSRNGEYAIVLRTAAQGMGAGIFATKWILNFAFHTLSLERVYLNVLSDNTRAINFYKKMGFYYEGEFLNHVSVRGERKSLKWYRIMKEEYEQNEMLQN